MFNCTILISCHKKRGTLKKKLLFLRAYITITENLTVLLWKQKDTTIKGISSQFELIVVFLKKYFYFSDSTLFLETVWYLCWSLLLKNNILNTNIMEWLLNRIYSHWEKSLHKWLHMRSTDYDKPWHRNLEVTEGCSCFFINWNYG